MSGAGRIGVLILSVDLELEIDHQLKDQERLDIVGRWLIDAFQRHRIPATWAVADPALSAATDPILASDQGHEIAVLGDRTWAGHGTGRGRLARELARRFQGARRVGIPASTLVLRNVDQLTDADLLLDHHVTAVRGRAVDSAVAARKMPSPAVKFGVWQAPAAWKIPPQLPWWIPGRYLVRREINRAAAGGRMLHLEIDTPRLVDSDDRQLRLVDAALEFAAHRRNAGLLHIQTIQQCATAALKEREITPSRSILRPAA